MLGMLLSLLLCYSCFTALCVMCVASLHIALFQYRYFFKLLHYQRHSLSWRETLSRGPCARAACIADQLAKALLGVRCLARSSNP